MTRLYGYPPPRDQYSTSAIGNPEEMQQLELWLEVQK